MFSEFLPTVKLFVSNVPAQSTNVTSSPKVGEAGNVAVNAALDVSQKYPSPATAVNPEVLTACQDVPPDTAEKDKFPEPSVFKNSSAAPVATGNVNV